MKKHEILKQKGLGAHTCKVSRKYINALSSYSAKTKHDEQTDGRTDGRTDGGHCNISRPRAYGAAGDNKRHFSFTTSRLHGGCAYLKNLSIFETSRAIKRKVNRCSMMMNKFGFLKIFYDHLSAHSFLAKLGQ